MNQKTIEPFVSVWMVTYNHAKFIGKALDSILTQQTDFSFKLVIGDDCSTDGTQDILKEYKSRYPNKIELILNSQNIGPTKNALKVYNQCDGKYTAMCEGDDYWTDAKKLQKQVDFLESNPDYNICFHEVNVYDQKSGTTKLDKITRSVAESTDIEELASGNYIHTPSVVYRNNFEFPDWFEKSPTGDWTLYMIITKDKKIQKLPEIMAVYRQHDKGFWSGKTQVDRMNMTLRSFSLVREKLELPPKAYQNLSNIINSIEAQRKIVIRKNTLWYRLYRKMLSLTKRIRRIIHNR